MRTELTILEKIDDYLLGKLTESERLVFEERLQTDEALRAQVSMQKDLLRAINRNHLRAQINTVSAAAVGGGSTSQWLFGLGGIVVVVGFVAGLIYYNQLDKSDDRFGFTDNSDTVTSIPNHTIAYLGHRNDDLILESSETLFSSQMNYDAPLINEDDMNVTVHFRSRGEGLTVDSSVYRNQNAPTGEAIREGGNRITLGETDIASYRNHTRRAFYPGGNSAMKKFIDKNLRYPQSALDKSIECVIRCEFHVTEDGLITEIQPECIKMAERDGVAFTDVKLLMNKRIMNLFIGNATHILRTMPIWEPALNAQGTPVLSVQHMYFNYDLERGCLVYQLDEDLPAFRID